MAETASEYEKRAMECARLASLTNDDAIQKELLLLRQTYLTRAASLGLSMRDAIALGEEDAWKRNRTYPSCWDL
ncbi:MAG TPA: hypothetical protein VNF99_10585 [Stellaceae bacterium]|nr:hypothetical protein [Stellaceae bacterium]